MSEDRDKWFKKNDDLEPEEDDDVEAHTFSGDYGRHGGRDSERERHGGRDSERERHGGRDS